MDPEIEEFLKQERLKDVAQKKEHLLKEKIINESKVDKLNEDILISNEDIGFVGKNTLKPLRNIKIVKKTTYVEDIIYKNNSCMKFYYHNLKDFIEKNLPCIKRPWIPSGNSKKIGRIAFDDAMLYRPGDLYNYVENWYVKYFTDRGIESPFAYKIDNIDKTAKEIHTQGPFDLLPHQKFVSSHMSNMTDFGGMLIMHKLGSGKCLKINTPVLMYDGSIKMCQNVEVGDLLMGDDSNSRKVLKLGQGQDVMYEVIPTKGDSYTFNSAHILSLKFSNLGVHFVDDKIHKTIKKWVATWFNNKSIKTVCKYFEFEEEAIEHLKQFDEQSKICNIEIRDFLKLSKRMQQQFKLYKVPVNFPEREVPFDPYIIGYWIGDGKSSSASITSQDSTVLLYFKKTMAEHGLNFSHYGKMTYGISSDKGNKVGNVFLTALRELDLINNKHIPDIYKINSRKVRLELLAGLIDSDGHLSGNCYEFVQKNETTMDGVVYLARTLGFSAYKEIKKTSWTHKGIKKFGTAFRITISGNINEIPCKIPRKQAKEKQQVKDVLVNSFKLVEKPIDTYYGFVIDDNHLYLLGDCTVTHNTITAVLIAESNKGNYISNGNMEVRQGSEIYKKNVGSAGHTLGTCNITIVVPKQLINQYLEEIKGSIENGAIKSSTAACVYVESDDQVDEKFVKMRQYYSGRLDSSGQPNIRELNDITRLEEQVVDKETIRAELSFKNKAATSEDVKIRIQMQMNVIGAEIKKIEEILKNKRTFLESNINKVYYIVSHDVYLNLITDKKKGGYYTASNFILGKTYDKKRREVLIHPDCFHTDKSVLIIDEIHKIAREQGTNYLRLYDMLLINARDTKTGEPRMKVILMTATPIYDNPHEASLILNFLRPRILMPLSKQKFDDCFIDEKTQKMKNKLLYQYLWSGYNSSSEGANPKSFPLRRNFTVLHEFSSSQYSGYLKEMKNEIKKDKKNGTGEAPITENRFSILPPDSQDETKQGKYLRPRQICNIYIPKKTINIEYDYDIHTVEKNEDNDKNSKNDFYNFIKDLRSLKDKQKILDALKEYSPKFYYIIRKIIDSKDEGPIVVYSEWVWYGILPIAKVLDLLGWEFLNSKDTENKEGKLRYGIWSPLTLTEMNINTPELQEKYTSMLQKIFNHKNNMIGRLCKVIFITVVEGINLKRVSQIHVTSPWWNTSKMEQIIGRAIRFFSHSDLPIEKQYVDVYYHCTVFDSFKNYPEINTTVSSELCEAVNGPGSYTNKYKNSEDLDRLTIEQKVYIKARLKNDQNIEFENAIKETSVDWQLNKYGNLARFDEVIDNYTKVTNREKTKNTKIFYNRSENKYYFYDIIKGEIYNLKIQTIGDRDKKVWPALLCTVEDKVKPNYWEKRNIEIYDNDRGDKMVSYIVIQKIDSFNNRKEIQNKNFQELMDYAITVNKEDPVAWQYFEDRRVKCALFNILVSVYNLSKSDGSDKLLSNFNDRITSGNGEHKEIKKKIENDTATLDLIKEIYNVTKLNGDKPMMKRYEKIMENVPMRNPIPPDQVLKNIDARNKFFFLMGEDKLEKIKKVLIAKYGYERNYLEELSLNPIEIGKMYTDLCMKERNKKKAKEAVVYEVA
jgi:hypothetical protein